MGSEIVIEKVGSNEKETFLIVGTTEADILIDPPRISNESPIWNALMWAKKWENVKVRVPAGDVEYKVISFK